MMKPFSVLALAIVSSPFLNLNAAEISASAQLAAAAPEQAAAEAPAPGVDYIDTGVVCRWPTGTHGYFDTAQVLGIKDDDSSNDYYPFAGKVEVPVNNGGDSNTQTETLGLKGGMTSESGHPNLFANGGDTKRIWEEALKDYKSADFQRAYYEIGLVAHLTQDQAVPAHAANINHVITLGDNFEKSIKKDLGLFGKVRAQVQGMLLADMEPWQYYQALQDDTRRQLPLWKDPRSNTLYWPPAPDAPALGQDATKGPWSHYNDKKDTYDITVSPEIMERQVLMASVYTAGVLRAAARRLPPVVADPEALRRESDKKSAVDILFNVYDNRKGDIEIAVERPLYGQKGAGQVRVVSGGDSIPAGRYGMTLPAVPAAIKGKDLILITVKDSDGNASTYQTEVRYNEPMNPDTGG